MRRAIVIGGSLGGICAARALAEVYDQVVVLDRDSFPTEVRGRAGVPQSRHAHVLLDRGRRELEALFPGFTTAMVAAGALLVDPGYVIATRRSTGWQPIGATGSEMLWSSRDLLEFTARGFLRDEGSRLRGQTQLRERCQVLGLRGSPGASLRVTGVTLRNAEGEREQLDADLVVDASGRGTRVESWLHELGLPPPPRERVDARAGYASRWYRPPQQRAPDRWWKGLWIEWEAPALPRAGVLFPVEGDRWLVTLAGVGEDVPPTDEQGFEAFMRRLSSPAIAQELVGATPLTEIIGNRQLANVYRRYDRWRARVAGFVAVGDAVCAFNPIYGQGMSVATTAAALLRRSLRDDAPFESGFERRFFRRQARFVDGAWALATRADFAWPLTEGERPPRRPLIAAYMKQAMRAINLDLELRRHVNPVFNLTGSSALFFSPPFVAGVLAATAKRELARRIVRSPIPEFPPAAVALAEG